MRAYFFCNMYLSSIQQGIQSAHALHEMFVKYPDTSNDLWTWARGHKTMIVLNGGYSESIRDLLNFFDDPENDFPYASFSEGFDALDGALTCACIVLPERIYAMAEILRNARYSEMEQIIDTINKTGKHGDWSFNRWEMKLIERLNTFGLAR